MFVTIAIIVLVAVEILLLSFSGDEEPRSRVCSRGRECAGSLRCCSSWAPLDDGTTAHTGVCVRDVLDSDVWPVELSRLQFFFFFFCHSLTDTQSAAGVTFALGLGTSQ